MQIEREEKQRKYQEARERLFGSPLGSAATSDSSRHPSPGATSTNNRRGGRDRGRGGSRQGPNQRRGRGGHQIQETSSREQLKTEAEPSQSRQKQLFEADYSPKPDSIYIQRQASQSQTASNATNQATDNSSTQEQKVFRPIREPKGPDRNGGIGFANRG
jgi:hypothetical protein